MLTLADAQERPCALVLDESEHAMATPARSETSAGTASNTAARPAVLDVEWSGSAGEAGSAPGARAQGLHGCSLARPIRGVVRV
jgi:hypothetical protein